MKRFSLIFVLVALLVAFVPAGVWALPGGTWNTGMKIQNLSATESATIVVTLYRENGTVAYTLDKTSGGAALQAPANGSVELYMPNYSTVAAGKYAAMVSSNQPIGVVATQTDYDYGLADSYNGTQGGTKLYVPYVYHAHNNWSTEIFVQNTTGATATVRAAISNGTITQNYSRSIPAYGMASFDTNTAEFSALGSAFIGAAVITSDQNAQLAVMVNESRVVASGDAKGNVLVSFRGLAAEDSGAKLVLPSLYREFSGASGTWRSGIKVQNVSATAATVTVILKADPDSPSGAFTKTFPAVTIPGNGGSTEYYLKNFTDIPNMFKGSAVVQSTGGDVVAMVIHTNYDGGNGYGVANGYLGIAEGATALSVPSLYKGWASGAGIWVSGLKLQNLHATESAVITVNFKNDPDAPNPTWTGTKSGLTLAPGASVELYLGNPILNGGGTIPDSFKGSATISSVGGELAGTVIHTNYGRHVANMYLVIPK